jgi:hypothetical protein
VAQLNLLNAQYPGRFVPAPLLEEHARLGIRYYPLHGQPLP